MILLDDISISAIFDVQTQLYKNLPKFLAISLFNKPILF